MLDGLLVAVAATAMVAGLTGAFSPCGFSMVDTIGSTLGNTRNSITRLACVTFTIGAMLGGVLTFGGLAFLGRLAGETSGGVGWVLAALIALAAAIADWRGLRIAPQIRRQVPESWRWRLSLPLVAGLYGVLLGLGFTTFVLSFAVWALAGISVAVGSPFLGIAIGLAFGLGRALPVIWLAPELTDGRGSERLEGMAAEPRLWLGLRRLDALGLVLCGLVMGAGVANASTLPAATDPSVSEGALAWQSLDGSGQLQLPSGERRTLPGTDPAVGESVIAWQSISQITVADLATMTPKLVLPVGNVDAIAISPTWMAYRDQGMHGGDNLIAVSLTNPAERRYVYGAPLPGEIGRPALDRETVVFAVDTPKHSIIEAVNLATGVRHVLRHSRSIGLLNPALLHGRLLYERASRCAQELRLGPAGSVRHDQVLLRLSSTANRDGGYEPGYEDNWNNASGCSNRPTGAGSDLRLGPSALSAAAAYVTEIGSGQSRIVKVER
jgi:hypothetical protein